MANPLFGMRNNYFNYAGYPYYPATQPSTIPNYSQLTYPYSGNIGNSGPGIRQNNISSQSTNPVGQAIQSMIPQSNIIWVESKDEIASYPTGRGWQQWFGDKNKPYLYVREMDMNGVIQPLKTVRFQIEDEPVQQESPASEAPTEESKPQIDAPTREEFNKLSDAVNMLVDKLGDLLK